MLDLFKKNAPKETGVIGSPSPKMLGDGFAVIPEDSKFVSLCDGEISMIFETGHAYAVTSVDGVEVLVHIGIDTVKENGYGFKILKKAGDRVLRGAAVIEADIDYLKTKYDLTTPCIITNIWDINNLEINHEDCNLVIKYSKQSVNIKVNFITNKINSADLLLTCPEWAAIYKARTERSAISLQPNHYHRRFEFTQRQTFHLPFPLSPSSILLYVF